MKFINPKLEYPEGMDMCEYLKAQVAAYLWSCKFSESQLQQIVDLMEKSIKENKKLNKLKKLQLKKTMESENEK